MTTGQFTGTLTLLLLVGCDSGLRLERVQPGVEAEAVDWAADPCVDFYQFACGNWSRWHRIAPEAAATTRGYLEQENQIRRLLQIVTDDAEAARTNFPDGPDPADPYARQIGHYYQSCRDAGESFQLASPELDRQLRLVDDVGSLADLPKLLARLQRDGVSPLLATGIGADAADPTSRIVWMGAGALSMERLYYVDAGQQHIRDRYRAHIRELTETVSTATGRPWMVDEDAVLRIELALAAATLTPEQSRDPQATYNPLTAAQLAAAVPDIDWTMYFAEVGIPPPARVDAATPRYLAALTEVLRTAPLDDLKHYLRWRLLESSGDGLGWQARSAEFAFHRTLFDGTAAAPPPWWSCFLHTLDDLGFAVARPFVAQAFGAAQRTAATDMIRAISRQMEQRLTEATWLDPETRAGALKKLGAVLPKVGYPDEWPSYEGFVTIPDDFLHNRIALFNLAWSQNFAQLGQPIDRAAWSTPPIVTNAFYSPQRNAITFPAAILQLPFFSLDRPAAANYGGIGSIMGHELTHGFDDKGRQYDDTGALRDWWSPAVADEFGRRSACLVDQFQSYHPLPGVPINGALTLGENLADLGGLKLAWAAFLASDGGAGQGAPGFFTPGQQFFIAFAQNWCANERPEWTAQVLRSDPHSPYRFRVNGTVSNLPQFGAAFRCPIGAPLAPANRCEVW